MTTATHVVLVVEDNEDDLEFLRIAAQKAGAVTLQTAVTARTLAEAREKLVANPAIRLVVLDIQLPDGDGKTLLAEIRSDPKLLGVAVVVFSSSADGNEVRECHRRGASAYVVKPSTIASHVEVADAIERFWVRVAHPGSG